MLVGGPYILWVGPLMRTRALLLEVLAVAGIGRLAFGGEA
jgi:hypothetical protein